MYKISRLSLDKSVRMWYLWGMERFVKPTDDQLIKLAILFNDGKLDHEKLADMLSYVEFVIDRLYENGDVLVPSSKEEIK